MATSYKPAFGKDRTPLPPVLYTDHPIVYKPTPQRDPEPCRICPQLWRISFLEKSLGKASLTLKEYESLFHAENKHPPRYEDSLCTFCAHLEFGRLAHVATHDPAKIPKFLGWRDVEVKLDGLSDIQARSKYCILCASLTAIITRAGHIDSSHRVSLIFRGTKYETIWIGVNEVWSKQRTLAALKYDRPDDLPQDDHYWGEPKRPYCTLDPSVKEIDWPTVRAWIEDSPKKDRSRELPDGFRLIDVKQLCVVRAPGACEYICLSYVWGTDTSFQATSRIICDLERPNSLGSSGVPRTIRDAIKACALLGKRYLWVDRLCILQDEDSPSKKIQIHAMGDIYSGAFVTIVALEGTGSGYGLYGVSPSLERIPYYRICIGGYELSESGDSLKVSCRNSKWNTRGWTYQEGILSPRLLFFTKHGLYYEDDKLYDEDDGTIEQNQLKHDVQHWAKPDSTPMFHQRNSLKRLDYDTAVNDINSREFGNEADIVNGFLGALHLIVGKGNHLFSMSLADFDKAITWRPADENARVSRQVPPKTAFPSWTWASIKGEMVFESMDHFMPVASWAVIDSSTAGDFRWLEGGHNNRLDDNEIAFGTVLWRYGCMRMEFPQDLQARVGLDEYRNLFRVRYPTGKAFNQACGVWPNSQTGNPTWLGCFTSEQIQAGRDALSILFHCQTVTLSLRQASGPHYSHASILHEEEEVGTMSFDLQSEYLGVKEMPDTQPAEVEFLALSVSWGLSTIDPNEDSWYPKRAHKFDEFWKSDATNLFYYLTNDTYSRFTYIYMNVLAVKTTDGISRRLGFGQIYLFDWLTVLKPTFKAIVLQ